jgi:hypothetical protein
MEIVLYVLAMFGGSLQYEPVFFWSIMSAIVVGAIAVYVLTGRLLQKTRKSKAA